MKMNKYHALTKVNYGNLQVMRKPNSCNHCSTLRPPTLSALCCDKITLSGVALTTEAVKTLPAHLAIVLLKSAIVGIRPARPAVITALLANWPLNVLCFREILDEDQHEIFMDELGFDFIVFRGITSRTDACKIQSIDFRGFKLNWTFTRLIIQMWPILSLRKSQRCVNRLTSIVVRKAGLKKENRLAWDIIPHLINDLLSHDMITHPRFGIRLARGEKLVVLLDRVKFTHQNTFFMDYLITNCLREITPLKIVATNVIINSELHVCDTFLDSLAPFIVFRGHEAKTLDGLCLENLEDSVFFATCASISHFDHLTSLALRNCNICLQEGPTRRRTAARSHVTDLLSSLPNLCRLDLSQNSFAGCLSEILASCRRPLHFLALHDCDLSNSDMDALAHSPHAKSLLELNITRICGLFPDDTFAVRTSKLMECLRYFTNLIVLWISKNQILDSHVDALCDTIRTSLRKLNFLHLPDNLLSPDGAMKVVRACCQVPSLQFVHVACAQNVLHVALEALQVGPDNYQKQVEETLRRANRPDIVVHITSLAYAMFGHNVDD